MTLPEIPDSWNKLIDKILQIIVLLVASWGAITGHNNAARIDQVQEHQAVNTAKIDAVKATAEEVKSATDTVKKDVKAIAPK